VASLWREHHWEGGNLIYRRILGTQNSDFAWRFFPFLFSLFLGVLVAICLAKIGEGRWWGIRASIVKSDYVVSLVVYGIGAIVNNSSKQYLAGSAMPCAVLVLPVARPAPADDESEEVDTWVRASICCLGCTMRHSDDESVRHNMSREGSSDWSLD
jgi:hypothetical protein